MTTSTESAPFAFTEWRQRVGIEREYKWSFEVGDAREFLGARSMEQALVEINLPDGFRRHIRQTYSHRQETAYLDDDWRLLDNESSVSVIINQGRRVSSPI